TVTTIIVFFPVVFLTGIGKFLFTPLALAVALSIGASYFVAMAVVPSYAVRFLHRKEQRVGRSRLGEILERFGEAFDRLRERYERALEWALDRNQLVLSLVAVAFIASLLAGGLLGTELFPAVDAAQISIQMHAPSGTRIERSEALAARLE